jgi:hypothetical protein
VANNAQIRPGAAVSSEYPPTTFTLQRKTLPKNNIVVGDDRAQIRFLEQRLDREAVVVEKVTDAMLMGKESLLYRVNAPHRLDLSPDVKNKTGIWSADALTKGSAGINALVKFAASLLGLDAKLPRESVEIVGTEVTRSAIEDIPGAVWQSVWLLSGEVKARGRWADPWKDHRNWMDPADSTHRLNSLYKTFVGWGYLHTNEPRGAKALGITPAYQRFLLNATIDRRKVYDSIKVLSQWKTGRLDPFVCALLISAIWA